MGIAPRDDEHLLELPLTDDELEQLRRIWPEDTLARVRDLSVHHEDYALQLNRARSKYSANSAYTERWASQLAAATRELIGCDPAELPPDLDVHIISSNTHSVANCLSPWMGEHADTILAWGRDRKHPALAAEWEHERDAVYAVARDYFRRHPHQARQREESDREHGMLRLRQTAFTGIQVELIDLKRLEGKPMDPGVTRVQGHGLVVNIDFAFGQQAGEILGALLLLFGPNIASVDVLGKAGALVGRRGDMLVPSAFHEQSRDLHDPVPILPMNLKRLAERAKQRQVHVGSMLTVAGTLLQNRKMLKFYRHIWRCVGLEMEGAYYFRRAHEAIQLGIIRPDVKQRYLYYVSDLPLDHGANLSASLAPHEGIPPLYAITREILSEVIEDGLPS